MTKTHRTGLTKIALSVAITLATLPALAQNTTSAVGGRITGTDGKPAGGAQVTILHKDSGSVNTTTTDADGRYSARGLRVGGPYTITITKNGLTEKDSRPLRRNCRAAKDGLPLNRNVTRLPPRSLALSAGVP